MSKTTPIICLASLLALVLTVGSSPVQAAGTLYGRYPDSIKIGVKNAVPACTKGKNFESYYDQGNAYGARRELLVACLKPDRTADWVLIAKAACNMPTVKDRKDESACLFEFDAATPDKPPYKNIYELSRYALGHECSIVRQAILKADNKPAAEIYWQCKRIDVFDSVNANKKSTVRVETLSSSPLASGERLLTSNGVPSQFGISPSYYEIRVGKAADVKQEIDE